MADRRSVFTDARVIEASKNFTCMADEVWRLQRGSEADCIFFQHTVNDGKRITGRGSYQGTWIIAPSGKLLARVNTRNIDKQLEVMQAGLDAWNALSEEERKLPADASFKPEHRWELNYPENGLVLERMGRELTPEGLEGEPHGSWNVDYAWATQEEMNAQVSRAFIARESMESDLSPLAMRLARFHLIDNVRGQSLPFAETEILEAKLRAIWDHEGTGPELRVTLKGHTKAVADGTWRMGDNSWKPGKPIPHGIECDLIGEAIWNDELKRFTKFELVAIGKRWGRTGNNGRGRDPSPGRVAFHFEIPEGKRRVAPTFLSVYDADWVQEPRIAEWVHSPQECGLEQGDH